MYDSFRYDLESHYYCNIIKSILIANLYSMSLKQIGTHTYFSLTKTKALGSYLFSTVA